MEAYKAKKEQEKITVSMQRGTEIKLKPQLGATRSRCRRLLMKPGGQQLDVAVNHIQEMRMV